MAASEKQIAANRRNAEKSTGPRTAEGRERSRANATTHGCTAATTIYRPLRHEDPAAFAEMRGGLIEDWNPVGSRELLAVEMIAAAYKRIQRLDAIEAEYFNGAMDALQSAHGKRIAPTKHDDLGCGIVLGLREHRLTWDNLDRYRRHAWLDYNRAVEQLRRLQRDRLDRPAREKKAYLAQLDYEKRTRVPAVPAATPAPPEMASFRDRSPDRFPAASNPHPDPREVTPKAA